MSVKDLLDEDFWKEVAQDLKDEAEEFWKENKADLLDTAKEEAISFFRALKSGQPMDAKFAIASRWMREDRKSWKAYTAGTLAELNGIATRRARMIEAIMQLSTRAAQTVGKAALKALGI